MKQHYLQHVGTIRHLNPRVFCEDGFSMSVQANKAAYCTPRADFARNYTHLEVGFPSATEELLMPYAESPDNPTGTVYGYVPIEVIEAVVAKHGSAL